MPIYTFCCPLCEIIIEKTKKMNEDRKHEKCPVCKHYMEIQLTSCSFHLKGEGWYVTDYKNKSTDKKKD
jgi:putative FmdB family regulatory protein